MCTVLSMYLSRTRQATRSRRKVSCLHALEQCLYNRLHGRKHSADHYTVRELSDLLSQVKDEQSYIVVRERTHRNTAESTNARVKWWSIFQLGVLIGEGIFQVWWLKRFFEVKRVV